MPIKGHKRNIWLLLIVVLSVVFYFILPSNLFNAPVSTVLLARNGELLSAKIAKDEQWRFPESNSIPMKFENCILQFEDEYFYSHIGFNPVSFSKALWTNIKSGSIKRGGSTITMQTIRLSRQ